MPLPRWVVRELVRDVYKPLRELDNYVNRVTNNYGAGFFNDDFQYRPSISEFVRPLQSNYMGTIYHGKLTEKGIPPVANKKDMFQVNLNVHQFKPEELKVKAFDDYLVVEGKQEENNDSDGFVSRQFSRHFKLPPNVKVDEITSNISSDGILTISVPKEVVELEDNGRDIPITQSNEPAAKKKLAEENTEAKTEA